MFRIQSRGSIALAAVVVALLSSKRADAQLVIGPGPAWQTLGANNPLFTGAKYDMVNQSLAEWHLECAQAKLSRDAGRGRTAAAQRDARRIEQLKFRIAADQWLIRKNLTQEPGFYPSLIDTISLEAIAQAGRPAPPPVPQ